MNTISLRLYPETEALYRRLLEESDAGTNGKQATSDQFINYLLECAQNPRKVEVPKTEDTQMILKLTDEVNDLRSQLHVLQNTPAGLSTEDQERITLLEHENFRLKAEITILKENNPAEHANTVIFSITDEEKAQIDDFTAFAKSNYHVELEPAHSLFFLIRDKKLTGKAY
ncbi:hypothetical protein JZU46_01070 [bacterium]|jgi:uncharacterized protein YajQ (UPF0234 family)|nr:hypothetical protein [bacterium]